MNATCTCLKRAWIRNADAPQGFPAPGHIHCPCGNSPETWFKPEQGNVTCTCGTVYTWDGWIVSEPPSILDLYVDGVHPLLAASKNA
jgi:hypothetical protein